MIMEVMKRKSSSGSEALVIGDVREPSKYLVVADRIDDIGIDYLIEGSEKRFAIERKTILDLKDSVKDGRLWRQLATLRDYEENGYQPILVIEGHLFSKWVRKKVSINEWTGWQVGIAQFGVPVIHVLSRKGFFYVIEKLKERAGKRTRRKRPVVKKRGRTIEEERVDVLCAIDGIGVVTAERLLERFGTIKGVVNAKATDLVEILGRRYPHFKEVVEGE